ncbi:hypothetical protein AB3S75_027365 [Citrus x aurantiifolia]
MKNKNEVLGIFLKWKKMVETQTSQKVKSFAQTMVVSTRVIHFFKYAKMRVLCDTSLFEIHHNRMGW